MAEEKEEKGEDMEGYPAGRNPGLFGAYGPYGVFGGNENYGSGMRYGNETLAADAHANGTAVKEAVDGNRDISELGMASIRGSFEDGRRMDSFNRVCDKLGDMSAQASRDRMETQAQISDARAEAAKCCCELGNKINESENRISKQIMQGQIDDLRTQVSTQQATGNKNEVMQAILTLGQIVASGAGCKYPGWGAAPSAPA